MSLLEDMKKTGEARAFPNGLPVLLSNQPAALSPRDDTVKRSPWVARGMLFLVSFFLVVIAGCATMQKDPTGPIPVAVWDLENLSCEPGAYPDMGRMLAGRIIETVSGNEEYQVVERQRLVAILEELHLGSSALASEETRLRIGKLSGARQMIFGGYQTAGDTMRIDLRLVEVETGKILKTAEKTAAAGDLAGWMDAAALAAGELF